MRFVVLPIVTLLLFACEDKPYADMTQKAHFERHGVAFDYPGNWALTETAAGVKDGSALHVMTVRTPSGAFVTIQSFEERMKLKVGAWADRLTKDYVRRFRERTQSFEAGGREGVERTFMGEIREGLKQSFTITDDERSSTLAAELFVAEFPGGTATLLIQGAGEDFARGKEGFELVLNTLKWTRSGSRDPYDRHHRAAGRRWETKHGGGSDRRRR